MGFWKRLFSGVLIAIILFVPSEVSLRVRALILAGYLFFLIDNTGEDLKKQLNETAKNQRIELKELRKKIDKLKQYKKK